MKCCAIPDLHGFIPEIDKDVDYLFIAGDLESG